MSLYVIAVIYETVLHGELIHGNTWRAGELMRGVVGKADKLINCNGVGKLTSWHGGSLGRVDELIHGGVGNKMMYGVVGRIDELIHCDGVGGLTS